MSERSFFRAKRPPPAGALLGAASLAAPATLAHAGDVDVWREGAAQLCSSNSNSSVIPPPFEPKSYFLRATFFIAIVFFFCMVLLVYRIVRMIQYKFVPYPSPHLILRCFCWFFFSTALDLMLLRVCAHMTDTTRGRWRTWCTC